MWSIGINRYIRWNIFDGMDEESSLMQLDNNFIQSFRSVSVVAKLSQLSNICERITEFAFEKKSKRIRNKLPHRHVFLKFSDFITSTPSNHWQFPFISRNRIVCYKEFSKIRANRICIGKWTDIEKWPNWN